MATKESGPIACDARERVESGSTPPSPPGIPNSLDNRAMATFIAHAAGRSCHRGTRIVEADDAEGAFYLVAEGQLRIGRNSPYSDDTTLAILHHGNLYYLARNAAHTWLEVLVAGTVVYRLGNTPMRSLARAHPALALALIDLLGQHLAEVYDRIEDLAHCSTRIHLAHTLGRLARADPRGEVHATHRELADMLGTTREEITRALQKLRAGGHIPECSSRRRIVVDDPNRLLALHSKSN